MEKSSMFNKGKRKNDYDILETQIYENFEKTKKKYYPDSILKPYLDNINVLSYIYDKKIDKLKNNKNNIHMCMSFNDRYVYQILVSISMAIVNCDKHKTFFTYHILCNPDVKNTTLSILKSLMYRYSPNLEMIFYDMGNNFIDRNGARLSQAAFYRLLTPIFINIDKLIYLDGDTIILKDLNEMYELPFNDNYILGFLDVLSNGVDFLGIQSEKYINSGVILLNLDKIRNDNKIYDIINIADSKKVLPGLDQTIINYVFYPKIGILPSKFGIWNFSDKKDIHIYLSHLRTKLDINELEESLNNPSIIHNVL
jgi:lipopolysaccharide biosynthesis glycosyltransferase